MAATERTHVPVWLVGIGIAVAFGAGYLAGDLRSPQPVSGTSAPVEQPGQAATMSAPPLTEEQLKGTLPANHPGFGATTPAGAATQPTAGATAPPTAGATSGP